MVNYFCSDTETPSMDVNKFCVAGINYKLAGTELRGLFAINSKNYESLLTAAKSAGLGELFVLSTCNRTEIYGCNYNVHELIQLLCAHTLGNEEVFKQFAYIKRGQEAVEHLFYVGAGLDSQILGDYEIVGQLKCAVKFAKNHGFIDAFTERLVNAVLQSSKLIKNNTKLSGGTVSVSFAAVQYIRKHVKNIQDKKILLIGVGKIGRITCKNIVDYLHTTNVTLVNRSSEKSYELANELGLRYEEIENVDREIRTADIILLATNSNDTVICCSQLEGCTSKLIIDLSVPSNVESAARNLSHIEMINVDELSRLKDETLQKRKAEIPKAREIISILIADFYEWIEKRKQVSILKDLKLKLKEIHLHTIITDAELSTSEKVIDIQIQRVLNVTAGKLKEENQRGCQYITAINDFISASKN